MNKLEELEARARSTIGFSDMARIVADLCAHLRQSAAMDTAADSADMTSTPAPRDPYAHADGSRECRPVEPQPESVDPDLAEANEADGVEELAAAMYNDCQQRRFSDTPDKIRSWPPMREIKHEWLCTAYAALAALKSRPKPSGEVVAWLYTRGTLGVYLTSIRSSSHVNQGWTEVPLYAAPPPAKPRLLTVEELIDAWQSVNGSTTNWTGRMTARLNATLQKDV